MHVDDPQLAPLALRQAPAPDPAAQPVVSVVITSYKSAQWIGQAIDSVLAQQVAFPVEIVIADDCSPDNTLEVVRAYERQYPHLFRVFPRERNVGTQRNYFGAWEHCRGRYIAWLDADDYWTDPLKLTRQVDALEAHPDVMVCGHFVRWVTRGPGAEVRRERVPVTPPGRYGMDTILRSNFLPSPSVMFRNGLQHQLPAWYFDVSPCTDWPLYIVAAMKGDLLLLDAVMADYTLNATSAFWGQSTQLWYESDAKVYGHLENTVPTRFRRLVRLEKGKRYQALAYFLRQKGEFIGSRKAALQAFRAPVWKDHIAAKSKALLASLIREAQWRLRRSPAHPAS